MLTGQARFLGDLRADGMLHAAFARTSVAHGHLEHVSIDEARHAPGVVAVFTGDELGLADIRGSRSGPEVSGMDRPPLVRSRVRYVGEAIAMVLAESPDLAADAVELVDAAIDPLPTVATVDDAMRDQTLLFPDVGSNVFSRTRSPRGATVSLGDWPVTADITVENERLAPVTLEPLGVLAEPGDDGVTVWCGHQAPNRLRRQLAGTLGIEEQRLRIRVPDTGGGFGLRGRYFPEYAVVTAAALRIGRPVRWIQTRSEQFTGGTHGRGMGYRVQLAGETDGRVRAARVEILVDLGAYPHNGSQLAGIAALMATGAYDIRQVEVTSTMVVTNRAPLGSYRGAGRPEAAYAIERAIEEYARVVGLDPVAVRQRNVVVPEAMPYRSATSALYDGGDYAAALQLALDLVESKRVRDEQAQRRRSGDGAALGLGTALFVERAGGPLGSSEYACVAIEASGRRSGTRLRGGPGWEIVVRAGTSATGQGHETVWSQVAAAVLGVDPRDVRIVTADTAEVGDGVGSFGSRSAQTAGSAIHRMSSKVVDQARSLAADVLEAAEEDLVFEDGAFSVRGDPSTAIGLAALAGVASQRGRTLAAEELYSPNAHTFPYGAVAAVVEVDPETGKVKLRRLVAVDDCGNVIHPQIVEGQVHGSLVQGIGQALYEGLDYDEDGQLRTATLVDYLVPAAPDVPTIETERLCTPAPSNPLGAKGSGESGCIGAPPAIVNAVIDALSPLGVRHLDMPLTPERVWRAIVAARQTRGSSR